MADSNDLFSSSVVLQREFNGDVVTDQTLPGHHCCYDIYHPEKKASPPPLVLIVIGFADYGRKMQAGKGLKDLPPYQSWGRLLASEGMATVIASCSDPVADLSAILDELSRQQQSLHIDMTQIAIWSCSGNGPAALGLLASRTEITAAVFCYAYLADLGDQDLVANTALQFGFSNPEGNKDFIASDTPLLIVRAGQDQFAGINETMDRYISALKEKNADVEVIDYPEGVHGFDLVDSSARSIDIIHSILTYLKSRLRRKT